MIDQIVTEKELKKENLASAVTKVWQTDAKNEQKIKKLKNEYLAKDFCPYTEWRNS